MPKSNTLTVEAVTRIADIAAVTWDACANPAAADLTDNTEINPFIGHAFLNALEQSGSVTAETGWAPHHLVMKDDGDRVVGVVPLYVKSHSQGEYVFDHGWADAYQRAGGQYYPKLLGSVPFTPATGRRLLAHPGADRQMIEQHLARAMIKVTERLGVSSLHLTFLPQSQWDLLGQEGFLQRTDQQYHWLNEGYRTFDEFLSNLASRKRKNLRKERAAALRDGIDIEWVTGSDIREDHWDAFFRFYIETGFRKWGQPYLTRPFFSLVGETMSDQILLVMCKRDGQYIAGALNFIGSETLFGRYWGCVATYPFLHFEVCYYQAIDFAIDKGLKRVEAGAQGPHKIARGYVPRPTYSAHYIPDPAFRDAVERYLQSERRHVEQHIEMLNEHTPFRRTTDESSKV
ncbi:MAG: N-acetyltransferase [Alphaproteobacteria bacterium]|nr:MAG: N-acetyltransferase [Alphaproteobacteria bacterium]